MNKIKQALDGINDIISVAQISQSYFNKTRAFLYHKIRQDTINGTKYDLTDAELETLINALRDIETKTNRTARRLQSILKDRQKQKGKYNTLYNPFRCPLFAEWYRLLPTGATILEPFAGAGDIIRLLNEAGYNNQVCAFDIEPLAEGITKRDTIKNFPKRRFVAAITNPPYLAKNSAGRRGLDFPNTDYQDLYLLCLDLMLSNCKYVAAIIPHSFLTTGLFANRLFGIASLTQSKSLCKGTDHPLCLALFVPDNSNDFIIYNGDEYIGTYNSLKRFDLSEYKDGQIEWKFNAINGNIGLSAADTNLKDIAFMPAEDIDKNSVKLSSRHYTIIEGLPSGVEVERFITVCNQVLQEYRQQTKDVFLTTFSNMRNKDKTYRRRLTFEIAKRIMNKALAIIP